MQLKNFLKFKMKKFAPKGSKIFYIAYLAYLTALFIENAMMVDDLLQSIMLGFKIVGTALILLDIGLILIKNKLKYFFYSSRWFILNLLVVTVLSIVCGDARVITISLFLLIVPYHDISSIMEKTISLIFILILMVIGSYLFGYFIPQNNIYPRGLSRSLSLGFYHYSKLPLAVLYLTFFYFLFNRKSTCKLLFAATAFGFILYYLCGSYNALICTIIFVAAMLIRNLTNGKGNKSRWYKFAKYTLIFSVTLSFILTALYLNKNSIGISLNLFFNNRLRMQANFLQYSGVRLFDYISLDDYVLVGNSIQTDNSYFFLLARFGIFGLAEFILLYLNLLKKATVRGDEVFAIVLAIFSIAISIDNISLNYGAFALYVYGFRSVSGKPEINYLTLKNYRNN